jgi:4-hydroxy-3-methylbut-2-enyl diphosphate reductase
LTSDALSRKNKRMETTRLQDRKFLHLAAPRGFCAGVDRAVRIVEVALEQFGAPVYVRHEIVHNRTVVDGLAAQGAIFVEELEEVPEGAPVVFSAHGVARAVVEEADKRKMIAVDATCPLVTKVHIEARRHAGQKRHILLIGHAGHPEVEGTMGQVAPGEMTLIETAADARTVTPPPDADLAFATQTTLSVDDTAEIISILQFRFPEITGPRGEDICYATTNRQNAVKQIASKCDLMLVVGAENSSNSQRLVEVALRAGAARGRLVDDCRAIDWTEIDAATHIGLSAGASAPESLVMEIIGEMRARYDLQLDEEALVEENLTFKLPSILSGGA